MIFVAVALAPRKVAPGCSLRELREFGEFASGLTLRQRMTVTEILADKLNRRGLERASVGGRIWCAVESSVRYDIAARGIDLGGIWAQTEEFKREAQWGVQWKLVP